MRSAPTCTICGASGNAGPRSATSHHFDPIWYLRQYPAVAEAIAAGKWLCALHHYLANDTPTAFDPLPEFSEAYYLGRYKDVAAAVEADDRRNGYEHFLANGIAELRSPSAAIDLQLLLRGASLGAERSRQRPYARCLRALPDDRARQGLATIPPLGGQVTERQAAALHRQRADNRLPRSARTVLDFSCAGTPAVSVILVLRDQFPLTLMTLGSLRANYGGDIELILIDAGSTDDTQRISRFVRGAPRAAFRNRARLRPRRQCSAELRQRGCRYCSWTTRLELAPGALAAALATAAIRSAHRRRRRQAASRAWPACRRPAASSGATAPRWAICVMPRRWRRKRISCATSISVPPRSCWLRADLLRELEGFDEAFAASLLRRCRSVPAHRARRVRAWCMTPPSWSHRSGARLGAGARPNRPNAQQALLPQARQPLRFRHAADRRAEVFARSTDTRAPRTVHRRHDSAAPAWLGLCALQRSDPRDGRTRLSRHGVSDEPTPRRSRHDLCGHARHGRGDARPLARAAGRLPRCASRATTTRSGSRARTISTVSSRCWNASPPAACKPPRIVLDTEAIAALRDAEHAALAGAAPFDVDAAIMRSSRNAHVCQTHHRGQFAGGAEAA